MSTRVSLLLDVNDPKRRMYCPNPQCVATKFTFLLEELGTLKVEVISAASTLPLISLSNGERREFKKGFVESVQCPTCKSNYSFEDAHSNV